MSVPVPTYRRRDPALIFVRAAVQEVLGADWKNGNTLDPARIDKLCEWAFSPDPSLARAATSAIFGGIVEPLCDDFSTEGVAAANSVLIRILQWIRTTPQGGELDRRLHDFGFSGAEAILRRYRAISHPASLPQARLAAVRKVIVLSRVTAGADIAITNVIVNRLRHRLPQAELVAIGPAHLSELFASVPGFRHRNFVYKNDGGLFEKMTSWPKLLAIAAEECAGLGRDEVLLFDPDSRLTQLGLLPLVPDDSTCYFPSRMTPAPGGEAKNLSALANDWMNRLLGETRSWRPTVAFPHNGEGFHALVEGLRAKGCRLVVCINFGVGNNPRKRVHGTFEADLVAGLLRLPGTTVILDTGRAGQQEQWLSGHRDRARTERLPSIHLTDRELQGFSPPFGQGLIVFTGSLGALGKMIDAGDCFIGYDSCGQHLAAATRTPAVIIFAGAPSERFICRWSPDGPGSRTIPVSGRVASPEATAQLIQTVIRAVEEIRTGHREKGDHDLDKNQASPGCP